MSKYLINITGNIATGKTTLSKHLLSHLPDYTYLSIDQYRKCHYNGYTTGEAKAQNELIKELDKPTNTHVILEHSGTGKNSNRYYRSFNRQLTILCTAPMQTIIERINNRGNSHNPYVPDHWHETPSRTQSAILTAKRLSHLYNHYSYDHIYTSTEHTPQQAITTVINWIEGLTNDTK